MKWQDKTLKSDTSIELKGEQMIREMGYNPLHCFDGVPVVHERIKRLYPDRIVTVLGRQKVVLFDGSYWHTRTTHQEQDDEKKDKLYVAAGYYPVHVGGDWFKNIDTQDMLKPKLQAALESPEQIVNIYA